ncbi:MAG TPA: LOG family protein [Dehalococcoidia bacterium]|nr:LOG family protein [Dehalococcoidia bacterium]
MVNQRTRGKRPYTPRRRPYSTGDPELDEKIHALASEYAAGQNEGLVQEMMITAIRLVRDEAERGEIKLTNAALKEFAYSFKVFKKWRTHRKISIFGSARTTPEEPVYGFTRDFAKAMAEANWMVITGAGPGIMAAGHEGAGAEKSFGASIRLPLESEPNMYIQGNTKLINYKYFFTRKVTFIKESDAFALMPGGFGTMDEAFELLTLMQTGKSDLHPVVLLEEPGSEFWGRWLDFMREQLLGRRLIDEEDLDLICHARTIEEAVAEVTRFYANYQSQRYVEGKLVIRLLRLPPEERIDSMQEAFADILGPAGIEPAEPTPREVADGDELACKRLAVDFRQNNFGRLRQLLNALNDY